MDPSHLVKAWMAGRAPLKHAMPGVPNTVMTGYKVGLKQNPSDLQEFFHTLFSNRSAI